MRYNERERDNMRERDIIRERDIMREREIMLWKDIEHNDKGRAGIRKRDCDINKLAQLHGCLASKKIKLPFCLWQNITDWGWTNSVKN